jgi:integrase
LALARPIGGRLRDKPPSPVEVASLLEAAEEKDPEWLTFLFLDAETGARRGELAALRLDEFTLNTVRRSKRTVRRTIVRSELCPWRR